MKKIFNNKIDIKNTDIKKIETKQWQLNYLFKQTISSWLILFVVYVLFVIAGASIEKTTPININTFLNSQNILFAALFCLFISFFYAIIKLVSIKNRIKLDKKNTNNNNNI